MGHALDGDLRKKLAKEKLEKKRHQRKIEELAKENEELKANATEFLYNKLKQQDKRITDLEDYVYVLVQMAEKQTGKRIL